MFILKTASSVTDAKSLAARNIIFLLGGVTLTSTFTHSRCQARENKLKKKQSTRGLEKKNNK